MSRHFAARTSLPACLPACLPGCLIDDSCDTSTGAALCSSVASFRRGRELHPATTAGGSSRRTCRHSGCRPVCAQDARTLLPALPAAVGVCVRGGGRQVQERLPPCLLRLPGDRAVPAGPLHAGLHPSSERPSSTEVGAHGRWLWGGSCVLLMKHSSSQVDTALCCPTADCRLSQAAHGDPGRDTHPHWGGGVVGLVCTYF